MSILIDRNTRLIVQGITGRDGAFHTQQMIAYGTKVVGGVTPGKGGTELHGVPVFDSVAEAVAATHANTSVIYVPAPFAADAVHEAADAGIALIVCITEGVPVARIPSEIPGLVAELLQRRRVRKKNGTAKLPAKRAAESVKKLAARVVAKSARKLVNKSAKPAARKPAAGAGKKPQVAKAPARNKK